MNVGLEYLERLIDNVEKKEVVAQDIENVLSQVLALEIIAKKNVDVLYLQECARDGSGLDYYNEFSRSRNKILDSDEWDILTWVLV